MVEFIHEYPDQPIVCKFKSVSGHFLILKLYPQTNLWALTTIFGRHSCFVKLHCRISLKKNFITWFVISREGVMKGGILIVVSWIKYEILNWKKDITQKQK